MDLASTAMGREAGRSLLTVANVITALAPVAAACSRPPSRSATGPRSWSPRWSRVPGWTTRRTRFPGSRACRRAC